MKPVRRALSALLLSLAVATPAAHAAKFSNVIVFGDSLSDAGYFRPFLAAIGLPGPTVATLGRFTTNPGPVWSELISQYYGVTPGASNAGGWIYAQGGATVATDSPSTPPGFAQRPVSVQITEYLQRSGGRADPNALFAVWAGGNDFLNNFSRLGAGQITPEQFQAAFLGAAQAEVGQVGRLFGAGARYVLVFSLPDLGGTPFALSSGAAASAQASQAAAGYNLTLFAGLRTAGLRPIPVDMFALFTEIRTNPASFGFTNITTPACGPFPPITTSASAQFCIAGVNTVAPNAENTYAFADSVHPTTGAHRVISDFTKSLIEGPTAYSLLAEAPLAMRSAYVQTINDGLAQGQSAKVGRLAAFASVGDGGFEIARGNGTDGLNSTNRSYGMGVTMRASEAATLGLGIGRVRGQGNFGGNLGSYEAAEVAYSAFASVKHKGFYGTVIGSLSQTDFRKVERNIALGVSNRIARASTDGSNSSFSLQGGYDFTIDKLTVGPTVTWTSQNVEVEGFSESGGGSAGLKVDSQTRRSEVAGIGVRASYNLGSVTPYIRVTADRERAKSERFVTATPLSLSTGNSYDIAAYQPADNSFITMSGGLRGTIEGWLGYGLQYTKVNSRQGVSEDAISATLSFRF